MSRGRAPVGAHFPGSSAKPINHGTIGGYRAHYRHGEPLCEPCRGAERKRRGYRGPQRIAAHGTVSGYRRHRRQGEDACTACLGANAEHGRKYKRLAGAR